MSTLPQTNLSVIDMYRGADFIRGVTAAEIEGSPDSFLSYSMNAQMRKNFESGKFWEFSLLKKEDSFVLFMDAEKTKTIPPGYYNYDIMLTHVTGVRSLLYHGKVNVIPTYTD